MLQKGSSESTPLTHEDMEADKYHGTLIPSLCVRVRACVCVCVCACVRVCVPVCVGMLAMIYEYQQCAHQQCAHGSVPTSSVPMAECTWTAPLTTVSRIFPGLFLASTTPKAPSTKASTTRTEVGRRTSVGRMISLERIAYVP